MVVDPGSGDIGVPQPLLDLGDVGLMVEGIGRRRRPQCMRADREAERPGIALHQPVDAILGQRVLQDPGAVVPDRPKQRAALILAVAGGQQIVVDQSIGARMQR